MEDRHPIENLNDGPVFDVDLLLAGDVTNPLRRRGPERSIVGSIALGVDRLPQDGALWTASHK